MKNLQSFEEHLNEAKSSYVPSEISKMYMDMANQWEAKINKYFLGKTLTTKASKHSEKRHNWEQYTIENITEIKLGSYFSTEIIVKAKDGEWYTLLNDNK